MSKHNHNKSNNTPKADAAAEQQVKETEVQNDREAKVAEGAESGTEAAADPQAEETIEQKLHKELEETKQALEKEKKEYLFLMAEFDNYRKRVVKEKGELIRNGAEKAMKGILPVVDDFERGLAATKDAVDAAAVREGMKLIYNKFVKYLAENGVKAMETPAGTVFDADIHEAVAMVPVADDSQKDKIIETVQTGYMLNDKVLRHAKVVVGQ